MVRKVYKTSAGMGRNALPYFSRSVFKVLSRSCEGNVCKVFKVFNVWKVWKVLESLSGGPSWSLLGRFLKVFQGLEGL